jgi:hypothetical protein
MRGVRNGGQRSALSSQLLALRSWRMRWGLLALLWLVLAVGLSGCADRNEVYVQGDWFFSAPGVGGITSVTSVHTYWNFDDGAVVAESCSEDRLGFSGHYRVVESEGDSLVLELLDVEGAGADDAYHLQIVIDRVAEALSIQGVGPFSRMP